MKVKVKYIPILFDESTWIQFESHNETVANIFMSLFQQHPKTREDSLNVSVRVNGKIFHPSQWEKSIHDGDEVLITQELTGEWIAGIIATLGTTIWGVSIGGTVYGFTALGWLAVAYTVASIAYTIYSYASAPSAPKTGPGLNSSPTYGWEGAQMQVRQGVPVPVVYGEHIIEGHTIGGEL